MSAWTHAGLTVGTALGCAVVGGVFFAFSTFIMRALSRLSPVQGIRAMQSINMTVINGWFMGAFFGTAAGSAVLGVWALGRDPGPPMSVPVACLLYLAGTFAVTIAFNVPRNEALARLDPEGPDAAEIWSRYLSGWTAWNHVRTTAALAAAALLAAAP